MARLAVLGCVFALGACTHVATIPSQYVGRPANGDALKGLSYSLPALTYRIEVERRLAACDSSSTPVFVTTPVANSTYVPGERFEVDPSALSSVLKTSSLKITYHEDLDTLKSFNAAADDKTADVLKDVARVGIAVASTAVPTLAPLAAGIAMGETPSGEGIFEALKKLQEGTLLAEQQVVCSADARGRLAAWTAAKDVLDSAQSKLKSSNDLLAREVQLAAFKAYSESDMQRLAALVGRALTEAALVHMAQEDFNEKAKPLTMKSLIVFPQNGWVSPVIERDWLSPTMEGTPSSAFCGNFTFVVLAKDMAGARLLSARVAREPSCGDYMAALNRDSSLRLRIERENASADGPMEAIGKFQQSVARSTPSKGIFIREPELARLIVEVKDPKSSTGWMQALRDEPRWMPQIGRLRFLPFESGPFENESLTLSLRKDGRVESAAYETKDAALARLANGAADATEKYITMAEKREAAARTDEKYAFELAGLQRAEEKARLEQEIAIREGNVERLRAAETEAAVTVEVAAQEVQEKAELEILRREKETLDLQEEIRKLRTPPQT